MVYKTIDEYIEKAPKETQSRLKELRAFIKNLAPDATETISYQIPTYKLNGKYLVYFAGWKSHIALYPTTSSMEVSEEISKYRTGKGTFQFPNDQPLPMDIIRKIVQIRIQENLEKK